MRIHKDSLDNFERSFEEMLRTDKDQAFESLVDTYGEEIKRLIFAYVKNWSQTDDLTQDVFVTVYFKLDTFAGRSSLKTWIYQIAINKCKDYLKSWYYRNTQLNEKFFAFLKDRQKAPDTQMFEKDERKRLAETALKLPLKYREVIILFYYKELSIEEIGTLLGLPQSTVKTRLARARDKLKTILTAAEGSEIHG